jgi:ABC-type lipoprotein export system ATPase subunit
VRLDAQPGGVSIRVSERPEAPAVPEQRGGETVARTSEVAKSYGATRVLHDLTLTVEAGRLTAVTGRSGSGKSTLLHLLAGLDVPSAGDVHVLDEPISRLDETARARVRRRHVGVVTQGSDLVPFLTAEETVELALALRGLPVEGARSTLAAVGLDELANQRVEHLSMGERQRVAVARALAAKPRLLLADEPTARLDEANARAVGRLFAELAAATGTAIVCATHDPVLIEQAGAAISLAA